MLNRLLAGMALLALASGAAAQDLPKSQFKVIGLNSPTPVSIHDELPFWRKTIPEASKGAITVDITPLDQMGIDDKTMLRLLKLGVMDFGAMDISKMAGDDPRFEASGRVLRQNGSSSWIDTGVGLLSPITLNWLFGRSCAAAPDAIATASDMANRKRCSMRGLRLCPIGA